MSLQKLIDHHLRSHPSLSYLFVVKNGEVLAHSFPDGFPVSLAGINGSDAGSEGSVLKIWMEYGGDCLHFARPILQGRAGI